MKKAALICVTRNNAAKLQATLNSIIRHTKPEHYDLFLIDNASSDETLGIYQLKVLADNITIVRSGKNLHWVGGINLGLEMTKDYQYVGFLNDDIEVCPNWLENFFDVLDSNPDVSAVGPISSNGRDIQGYDCLRKSHAHFHLAPLEDINRGDQNAMLQALAAHGPGAKVPFSLGLFSILLRRSAIDAIGGLDPAFAEVYFGDDEDYCRRLRDAGHYLALSFQSYFIHHSGSSSRLIPDENNRRKQAAEIRAKKCGARVGINKNLRPYKSGISGIDQIWVINLERRKDRLERFKQNNTSITDKLQVFKAFDAKNLQLTQKIARLFAPNSFGWNKATMGCSLSHLALWQTLANVKDEDATFLIFEDDTVLSPGWESVVGTAFKNFDIPQDWDVLYLGGVLPRNVDIFERSKERISGSVSRIIPNQYTGQKLPNRYFHFGAFAYLLNKTGAIKLLECINQTDGIWLQADYMLGFACPERYNVEIKNYFLDPLLAKCYQDVLDGFAKSYSEDQPADKIDSDIWKESQCFEESTVRGLFAIEQPYDIVGALEDARDKIENNYKSSASSARISLLHATRGRPSQAIEARRLWLEKAKNPERVEHIFAFDQDDESSWGLKEFQHVVQLQNGFSVGAWNLAAKHSTGDILIQLSDDWNPPDEWDKLVEKRLDISLERVLWINDGHRKDELLCMAILTRKYYDKHGLFDPRFRNVYSDDDFTVRAKKAGAIVDARGITITHNHPEAGLAVVDETYRRGNAPEEYERAKAIFEAKHPISSTEANSSGIIIEVSTPSVELSKPIGVNYFELNDVMPIKVLTTFTPSHRCMFNECFLPSLRKADKKNVFAVFISEMQQISPTMNYGTQDFRTTTAEKLKILIATIKANKGKHIIYSDPDVQFFDGFAEDVLGYLDNNSEVDAFCQNDYPRHPTQVSLCTGFMVLKCNDRLQNVFEKSLQNIDRFRHDQDAFNFFREGFKWRVLPEEKYYTVAYNTGNAVWNGEKYDNIPKTILMHHANWTVGVENKLNLLDYIKREVLQNVF